MKRRKQIVAVTGVAITLVVALLASLTYTGVIWPNRIWASSYPVRGVDVSYAQGAIDWSVMAQNDIEFAFIKATEGSGHTDKRFARNWTGAAATPLIVGAYHFFSFESPGETQAENFISSVPVVPGTLPPVIDIEAYADFDQNPPSRENCMEILVPLVERLTQHYGVAPIIYTTMDYFDRDHLGAFDGSPIWIRSVLTKPRLRDGSDWSFWQYSARDQLDGYHGPEKYIDMNVFKGSRAELEQLVIPTEP